MHLLPYSSHQSRIALTIDEIYIVSGQIRSSQIDANHNAMQQLDEHSRILSRLLSGQSKLQDLLQLQTSVYPAVNTLGEQASVPIIGVRAFATQHQRSPCSRYCRCKCHHIHSFQSPGALHELIGTLFIGYSGCPVRSLQRCTEPSCLSQTTFRTYVHYLFPSWFLTKALTAAFLLIFPAEIQVALTIRSIVPNGADIFRLQRTQDVDGMKKLFGSHLASPNDSDVTGMSTLGVSHNPQKHSRNVSLFYREMLHLIKSFARPDRGYFFSCTTDHSFFLIQPLLK